MPNLVSDTLYEEYKHPQCTNCNKRGEEINVRFGSSVIEKKKFFFH